jgi:hypothetical protein
MNVDVRHRPGVETTRPAPSPYKSMVNVSGVADECGGSTGGSGGSGGRGCAGVTGAEAAAFDEA